MNDSYAGFDMLRRYIPITDDPREFGSSAFAVSAYPVVTDDNAGRMSGNLNDTDRVIPLGFWILPSAVFGAFLWVFVIMELISWLS